MRTLLVGLLLLPLAQIGIAAQQPAGDPAAGKALWDGANTQCKNCHGNNGEGAYGPDLAGRQLSVAQFRQAVRKPWGVMPAFIESQVSDKEIADLQAYFSGLPGKDAPGPWRFTLPANAAKGHTVVLATAGCGQCHGEFMAGPRSNLGAVNADFEYLKRLVYTHTTAMPEHWKLTEGQPAARVRMGNFNPARLTEAELQEVYNWFKNDLGFRVPMGGQLSAGVTGANGTTYTLNVTNNGVVNRGLTAEDITVLVYVPAGMNVVSATGAGYQGVRADAASKQNAAVWTLPKLVAKERQTYTITVSKPGTKEANLSGAVRWNKPEIKPTPGDAANIAPAPLVAPPAAGAQQQ